MFVGPREDPFAIDVGRIFDFLSVGGLGTDNLKGVNVHTIAIEVPGSLLRKSTSQPVIGVWAATDRQVVRTVSRKRRHGKRVRVRVKQWKQVERLGQPLVNEVLIPRTLKDYWNTQSPAKDKQFEKYYTGARPDHGPQRPRVRTGARRRPRLRRRLPGRPGDGPRRPLGDPAPRLQLRQRCRRPDVRQHRLRQDAGRRAAPQHEDAAGRHARPRSPTAVV